MYLFNFYFRQYFLYFFGLLCKPHWSTVLVPVPVLHRTRTTLLFPGVQFFLFVNQARILKFSAHSDDYFCFENIKWGASQLKGSMDFCSPNHSWLICVEKNCPEIKCKVGEVSNLPCHPAIFYLKGFIIGFFTAFVQELKQSIFLQFYSFTFCTVIHIQIMILLANTRTTIFRWTYLSKMPSSNLGRLLNSNNATETH